MKHFRLPWKIPPRLLGLKWRYWRVGVQVILLGVFLYLYYKTEANGAAQVSTHLDDFFLLNPLSAATAMLAAQRILSAFWPAAVMVLFTILLGRFFCGWICPLGTLLDGFHRLIRPVARPIHRVIGPMPVGLRSIKYFLLILTLWGAMVGFSIIAFVEPFALLYRGLAFAVAPALNVGTEKLFHWTIQPSTFQLANLSALILGGIFVLEFLSRRFWCRYVCPLGGMVGLLSHFALLRREPVKKCQNCPTEENCHSICRMRAFDSEDKFSPQACNLCMDCMDACSQQIGTFTVRLKARKPAQFEVSRRIFLTSVGAGLAIPMVVRTLTSQTESRPDEFLIRPPGAQIEETFLSLCLRCGLCLKICPTNGLQPAGLEAGVTGMFTPHFDMRKGYCEYDCTLCGQVCPSGAIPLLTTDDKHDVEMGVAQINPKLCRPYSKGEDCSVCEKNCPVPNKAILHRRVECLRPDGAVVFINQPYVKTSRCIGCGLCENVCPEEDMPAIRVRRRTT